MLLDTYQERGLLFNANLKETTSKPGALAYRGELVLKEGEITDDQGRRKPPLVVLREAALLEEDGKLSFVTGFMDELADLPLFLAVYGADCAPNLAAAFYIADIPQPMKMTLEGYDFLLIPLTQGFVWNELVAELGLEKSDFKGQSAGDKVITLAGEFRKYQAKYEQISYETALGQTTGAKRETHGAV
ncbi:MAG: hypothetical protein EPN21_10705 [Methylococcaceae bacterium]|nr:MAG: hypothetical protein EPN21_10705 [Methylococcaceae bacterium]